MRAAPLGVVAQRVEAIDGVDDLGRAVGHRRHVAEPQAGELQRLVQRAGARAAGGALGRLGALALGALALARGQVVELLGQARLDVRLRLRRRAPWPARGSPATGAAARSSCSAPRAKASALARSLGPSPKASRAARSPSPRPRRAHACAVRRLDPVQAGGDLVGARRVEAHVLAARGDGGQDLARAVGQEHEVREVGGLLERLEHPVGGLVVHRLGALDDEHAPARLERRPRRGGDDGLVDVGDEHLGGAAGRHPREVGVHAVLDARRAPSPGRPRRRSAARRRRRAATVALPDAAGPVEEVGVAGAAVGRQRAAEDGAGVGVTLGGGEHLWKATAMRGRLITIEGLDGSGKTTLADALVGALRADGREVVLLREPGGVELSERIRALVKDPALAVDPRAEALLYAAARAQLVAERVEPALAAGTWVLLDRFVDSSLAYQGVGRGLGVEAVRRDQPLRHRRAAPRPDAAAARRRGHARGAPGGPRRGARPARARGRTRSSRRSRAPTTRWRRPSPSASACSTRVAEPAAVLAAARAALADLG